MEESGSESQPSDGKGTISIRVHMKLMSQFSCNNIPMSHVKRRSETLSKLCVTAYESDFRFLSS